MSVIYVLITVSLLIAIVFFIAFIVSVRSGQFDDSVTPSIRMLFENKPTTNSTKSKPLDKS
jgi:cbb3-type cytochrome oxidase maturation protein